MIRKTLLGLAAVSFAAFGAAAANAGSYGAPKDAAGAEGLYQQAGYYCHWHYKKVRVQVLVGYDSYGNPIYKYRYKTRKWCHKHYNNY